jgi:HSP20 family protein
MLGTTRWNPSIEANRLRNEMERLFGRWSVPDPRMFGVEVFPPLNLWEDDNNVSVEAELPGLELGDLEIYVAGNNQLSIKGQRKQPPFEGGVWHRRERSHGDFSRMIELPCDVESDKVAAEFRQGVLTITMPKSEEVKPWRIPVHGE